jgi:hypothetical protein
MALYDNLKLGMKRMAEFFMNWIQELPFFRRRELETPHGLLAFLDAAGGRVLEVGFFSSIVWSKWHHYSCSDSQPFKEVVKCSWQAILPCALVAIVGSVYYLSRHSAKVELAISDKLFPKGHIPDHWIVPRDPVGITISVMAFFVLYLVLALVSDRIRVVSFLMLMIACIDFNTRRLINARTEKYFDESQYAPSPGEPDYNLIRKRREVIRDHLNKPYLWKEGARAGGCAVALAIAMSGLRSVSYVVLMITLIVNEIVTWNWRADRDRALLPLIDQREAAETNGKKGRQPKSFSTIAWIVSVLYMALAAYVSWKEHNFTHGFIKIGFVNHGGMWGDLIILPVVNGLVVPHFPRITAKRSVVACALLACAITVAVFAHEQWAAMGKALGTTDFVFPEHSAGIWYNDMSVSGYLHLVYMSLELTLILAYSMVSMPVRRILWVSGLLTIHVILGQVQPGWYSSGTIWNARTIVPTFATVLLIWLVGLYKLRQERRRASR